MFIVLRNAEPQDTAEATAVLHAAFERVREIYRPSIEILAQQTSQVTKRNQLLAEYHGRIVGTVQYVIREDHTHLIGLAVHPEFQRLGIARALIDKIAEWSKQQRIKKLTLVTVTETGNVSLFERLGFRIVSEKTADWCESDLYDQLHETEMERPLNASDNLNSVS